MFTAITSLIKIEVEPAYLQDQSRPDDSYYFFSYKVRIRNEGADTVQLLSRHWIITNGNGQIEEVAGPGVVGMQPTLKPGDVFEYSSFCPLTTPTGYMQGKYVMIGDAGDPMEIEIPMFILSEPNSFH